MENTNGAPRVLLFYMSLWMQRKRPQTNEAALEYLIRNGKKPERILALCSDKVRNQTFPEAQTNQKTTLAYYRDDFLRQAGYDRPEQVLTSIDVPDTMQDSDRLRAIRQVAEQLPENTQLTIDLTGGMRDTAALLVAIARYLQSFKKLTSCEVLYTELGNAENGGSSCRNVTVLYDVFDLIAATELFLETGSARKIDEFFKNHGKLDKTARKLIRDVREFSDSISLCQFDHLEELTKGILQRLKKREEQKEGPMGENSLNRLFFDYLAARFEQEFDQFQDRKKSLPEIVEWCADRGMYQQALTLLTEDMPVYACCHTGLQPGMGLKAAWKGETRQTGCTWPYYLFHAHIPKITGCGTSLDYLEVQQKSKKPAILFPAAETKLLAEVMDCYKQVHAMRNGINHANGSQDRIRVDQVKELLTKAVHLLQRLKSNPRSAAVTDTVYEATALMQDLPW